MTVFSQGSVIARVQGGLGNQLFCYAYGRAVAARLGRPLILDVSQLERADSYGRAYELPAFGVTTTLLSEWWLAGVAGRVWRKAARTLWPQRMVIEPARAPDSAAGADWIYLDGYWQHESQVLEAGSQLRRELGMGPVGPETSRFCAELEQAGAIGIHIRFYGEEKVASRRSGPSAAFYQNALERLIAEFGERPIYVASDDGDRFRRQFPQELVRRVAAISEPSMHDDFAALRHCRYHVLSNSSFGWWAAFLADSQRTYYPKNEGYFHYASPAPGWRLL